MRDCVLCLSHCSIETALSLFSIEGVRLNLPQIGGSSSNLLEVICQDCWRMVDSFNEFYYRVLKLHQHRSGDVECCAELNALKKDGFCLFLEANTELGDPVDTKEKKPQVLASYLDGDQPLAEAVPLRRSPRRVRPPTVRKPSPHPAKQTKSLAKINLETDLKDPVYKKEENQQLNSDSNGSQCELLSTASETICRKRRGRPPKVQKEPLDFPKQMEKEIVLDDDNHDIDFVAAENGLRTDDPDGFSSNESDSLPDIEPEERYAEIPKRKVMNPSKYRKRKKPVVQTVRLSRTEIERRKAQQGIYDEIILSFFEKFPCDICNLLVQNFADMRMHQRMSHNIEICYMTCCGRKYYTRKNLAEHVLVHRNPNHFLCFQCKRSFQDSRSLELHKRSHSVEVHGTEAKEKQTYQCARCPKSFTTKAAVEYHNVSKHVPKSEYKFHCLECNKKFPIERKLKDHMRYVHDPASAIICDKCGITLSSPKYLKKHHELKHSDEPRVKPKPVQCEICGAWLSRLAGLKKHMETVHETSTDEHRCHICDKISTNSRSLKRHIYLNHFCERKFKCGLCEKAFKRPQDLREHTSTHTGEVLYTCPNCPMTFFCNANMYKHRQRLHRAEWEADRKKPLPPKIKKISQETSMKG